MILEYQEFSRLIERFAIQLPAILARHHRTADLAPKVAGLLHIAETPFTLAVVGQMRVGKSSLLNALCGTDMAVVGVTETTATINWFKYGQGAETQRFRVTWKDRPAEDVDLKEIHRWMGESTEAANTASLEFFAETDFLKIANIVDTPGTRSAITSHTEASQEFLAARREGETHRLGGEADAIIYVVPPVAREPHKQTLRDFEDTTRLPGSTPYNSLAVLHKWETIEAEDAYAEAGRKAERMFKAMNGLVSAVLPASAPLGRAAEQFEEAFWNGVLNLTANSPGRVVDRLLLSELNFLDVASSCSLTQAERSQLRTVFNLPWACLKVIIQTARRKQPGTGRELRNMIAEMSGLERLRQELRQRFFARSKMIKSFSVLSKARESCRTAEVRLRNHKTNLARSLETGVAIQTMLANRIAGGETDLRVVQEYLQTTLIPIESDLELARGTLVDLGRSVLEVEDAHREMNADLNYLQVLQRNSHGTNPELVRVLFSLFGGCGAGLLDRLSFLNMADIKTIQVSDLDNTIDLLRGFGLKSGREWSEMADHGIERLEEIANWLAREQKP